MTLTRPVDQRTLMLTLDVSCSMRAVNITQLPLVTWGRECKLKDLAPRRIRRTLEPAHSVLIEKGYLTDAEYVDTAEAQVVVYREEADSAALEAREELQRHEEGLRARSFEEQVEYVLGQLTLFVGQQLSNSNLRTVIRDAMNARLLDLLQVERDAIQAAFDKLAAFYTRQLC